MEKLANHIALQSIAEGGMEKQALNAAQLLRIGHNFALRGKMDRFNTLMDRRAQAASKVFNSRMKAWRDAVDKHDHIEDYLLAGDANHALPKMQAAWNRVPSDPIPIIRNPNPFTRAAVDADVTNDLADLMREGKDVSDRVLGYIPKYNSDQLATFSRALKRLDPALHKQVLTTGSF
jgi:hypothetical protein